MILRHCFFSHVVEYSSWFSQGFDRDIQENLLTCKPQFKADDARIKDKCLFQVALDNGNIAVGVAEVVLDNRPCTHEHIIILSLEQYIQLAGNLKILWDKAFIDYARFIKNAYRVGETIPPLSFELGSDPGSPSLNIINRHVRSPNDLADLFAALFSMTTDKSKDVSWEIGSFESATELLSALLFVVPPQLSPFIPFFVGLYPEHNAKQFKLRLSVGTENSGPIITGEGNNKETIWPASLSGFVVAEDSKHILLQQRKFGEIHATLNSFFKGRELNARALETPDLDDVLIICLTKLDELMAGNDLDGIFSFGRTLSVFKRNLDERLIYERFLGKARKIFQDSNGDLMIASRITSQMKARWGSSAELNKLENKISFLINIRSGNVARAMAVYSSDQTRAELEELLENGLLNRKDLIPFFLLTEDEFAHNLARTQHPSLFAAFKTYQIDRITASLTAEKIRNNPDLVQGVIKWLTDNSDEIERNSALRALAGRVAVIMDFDPKVEMEILVDPRSSKSSLLQMLPPLILAIKARLSSVESQALEGKYVMKIALGMAKETKKGLLSNTYDFYFNTQLLHGVYAAYLNSSLRQMGWPNVVYSDKTYAWCSGRLLKIVETLKDKHGEFEKPRLSPAKNSQPLVIPIQASPAPVPTLVATQNIAEAPRLQMFQSDMAFWDELRKNPNLLDEKYSSLTHFENNPILLTFSRMDFDCIREMDILVNGPDSHKSLFVILPAALKYFFGKTRESQYVNLVWKFTQKVNYGLLKEKITTEKPEPELVYRFDEGQVCERYHEYLDKKMGNLISSVQSSDNESSRTYDEFRIITGNLAWVRLKAVEGKTIPYREFYVYYSLDQKTSSAVHIRLSDVIRLPEWKTETGKQISLQNAEMLVRVAISKYFPEKIGVWRVQYVEKQPTAQKELYVFLCTNSENSKSVPMIMASDGTKIDIP